MAHRRAPKRWPTTAGGLGGDQDWTPLEAVVADLLAGLTCPGPPAQGEGLLLSYLPFTDLGRDDGEALCWEANLSRGGSSPGEVSEVGGGQHPLLALLDLPSTPEPAGVGAGQVTAPETDARRVLADDLQRRWAGWSVLLHQAAVITSQGSATAREPSGALFDLDARWSHRASGPGWVWHAGGMEVLDQHGGSVGTHQWTGASPSAALHAALVDAGTWFSPSA